MIVGAEKWRPMALPAWRRFFWYPCRRCTITLSSITLFFHYPHHPITSASRFFSGNP
jgi:hypothetical protein